MDRKIIILTLAILLIVAFSLNASSIQDFNNITFTLDGSAIQPFTSINLTLGDVAADTCSCPGLNQNWQIDMSDNCSLSGCELGTGILNFTNTTNEGTAYCTGSVNASSMTGPPFTFTLLINSTCRILLG